MYTNEEKLFLIMIAATVIVAGIIAYFLYSMVRQFRRYRQLQNLYNQAKIEALDNERQLIAADLHDDIGPILSATLFKLSEIEPAAPRQMELLQESREHVDSIFVRIRELSTMLAPQSIERKGPLHALQDFSEGYKRSVNLELEIHPVICKELPAHVSLHLFRMLQEIMHNAIRHSKAKKLIVSGEVINKELIIQTSDDGIGFDLHAALQRPGLGLQNLQIRAGMIGAEMSTETGLGKGTKYRISVGL